MISNHKLRMNEKNIRGGGPVVLTYRNMGVSGVPLGVSCREDGVDKDKSSDDLSAEANALVVARSQLICATAVQIIERGLEGLHQPHAADCTQALSYYVQERPHQRHLPRQEESESHRRVDVSTCGPS